MKSPLAAILWERWACYRWWLMGGLVYFAVVAVVCHLLPQSPFYTGLRAYCIFPMMTTLLVLVVVFVCGAHADLSSSDSLFPRRMFNLPVSTRTLVGSPMLAGVSTMFLACVFLIALTLRTIRPECPLFWPALLAAVCLAWLQALAWVPFGLPYLRVMVGVPLVGLVIALPGLAHLLELAPIVLVLTLAAQIPLAYCLAAWGIARARQGDSLQWDWLVDRVRNSMRRKRSGTCQFSSVGQAQRWLEWRRNGPGLTVGVLLATPFAVLISFFSSAQSELVPIMTWVFSPLCILLCPVMMSVSAGAEFGYFRASPRESGPCDFLAMRPMGCADFVLAKLGTAVRAVLFCYAVALPTFLLATLLTGWHHKMLDGLLYLTGGSTFGAIGIALLLLFLLPALTWKFTVENMFLGLCGRKWVGAVAIPFLAGAFWLVPGLAWWISRQPNLLRIVLQAAPWLLVALVAAKLLLTVRVYRVLRRRRLIEPRLAQQAAMIWLAAVIVLSGLALWLIPSGLLPWHSAVCAAVLSVPIARLGLAPLALAWNRHR